MTECDFLFAALAEKHNTVIRKIREIPPWEWDGEFLKLEPQVLRFLGTSAKHHPERAAFRTAYTLASALAVYRLTSRKPKTLTEQEREDAYREMFNFLNTHKAYTTLATGRFDRSRTGTRIRTRSSSGVIGMKVGFGLGLKPTDSTTKSIDRYHSVSFLIPEFGYIYRGRDWREALQR